MKKALLAATVAGFMSSPLMAQELSITVTNLTHGNTFTPVLVSAHTASNHIFQLGTTASASIVAMAEGGALDGLMNDLNALAADSMTASGLTPPAMTQTFSLTTQANNTHLSVVAMILPSNDGFIGADAIEIPSAAGTYEYYLNGYDAGSEVNDEIINGGGAAGVAGIPADPAGHGGTGATGVTSTEITQVVHIHRGIIGDTDATGGKSDLDSRIHRWLNPVAKLTITVQ